ncbi:tetratricopeptide repeat protein [Thalassotalea fusca]
MKSVSSSVIHKVRLTGLFLPILFTLLGCQTVANNTAVKPDVSYEPKAPVLSILAPPANEMASVVKEDDIFALSEEQKEDFFSYYRNKLALNEREHHIVSSYVTKHLDDFDYFGDTFVASEALKGNKGNCMSLAVITSAYAKLLDMKMDYRLVLSQPVYEKSNGLVITSKHVQTRIFEPQRKQSEMKNFGIGAHVVVDYFPRYLQVRGAYIKHNAFVSLFYQNMAGQYLSKGDAYLAYANAYQAYQLDPNSSSALNLLALASKHKGELAQAENIYRYILEENADDLLSLNNYVILLRAQGRGEEAMIYQEQLDSLYDPNPYNWIDLAEKQLEQDLLQDALSSYNKAIRLAPYLQEPYIKAYRILLAQGRPMKAEQYLQSSLKWVFEPEQRSQIKYKLYGQNL